MEGERTFVISLGGSMIVPDDINGSFLSSFVALIKDRVEKGDTFFITTGGGAISRMYTNSATSLASPSSNDLDWIGIQATRINAELVRTLLRPHTPDRIVYGREDVLAYNDHAVVVGGGWQPGGSSDMATVFVAREIGAKHIVNLSNVSYVYTADPKKDPAAEKVTDISWGDYRNIIPPDWTPGANTPFDPTASRLAEEAGIEVAIMNGANLENLRAYLDGQAFEGTRIH